MGHAELFLGQCEQEPSANCLLSWSGEVVGFFSQMQNIAFEICEPVAEAQALIHDHVECGKHTAEEVVTRLRHSLRRGCCYRRCMMWATSRRTPHCRRIPLASTDARPDLHPFRIPVRLDQTHLQGFRSLSSIPPLTHRSCDSWLPSTF